jgi:sec-independent protein translocase protein TatC
MPEEKRLTFIDHLQELKRCMLKSVLFLVIVSCLTYSLVDIILRHLVAPVERLVFIAPHEAFMARIKIAVFGGLFLSSPYILYQAWYFIRTGLKESEKRYVIFFGPLSFVFFVAGAAFGYLVIVPIGIDFLLGFSSELLEPMISVAKYISFIGLLTLAFGLVFQLPIASLFLTKIGLVTPRVLASRRREAVVSVFVAAAILTPPDIVTQCLMAVPLILLYELGIIFSRMAYRPR